MFDANGGIWFKATDGMLSDIVLLIKIIDSAVLNIYEPWAITFV